MKRVVMPLGAGLPDWRRHRRTRIETTAGARKSAMHSLMPAEADARSCSACSASAGFRRSAARR
ncbi:MAG TPA: hypothetical protein VFU43_26000 [Streptosporangiaceae bacterium]|nr:hypothetical protein [Streptosporangiaceae bacterium]